MSAPGKVIYTLLSSDSGVAAIVGTNIYAIRGPEAIAPPYAVISKVSDVRDLPISGLPGTYPRTARLQVSCYANTAAAAKSLADAARNACDRKSGMIDGVQTMSVLWDSDAPDGYDFDLNLYHQPVDFFVHYYL